LQGRTKEAAKVSIIARRLGNANVARLETAFLEGCPVSIFSPDA